MDTLYTYVSDCWASPERTTIGNITFTDYEVLSSDGDILPAADGYEWHAVTLTFTFDDENAKNYGANIMATMSDYYDIVGAATWNYDTDTYSVNFNGIDYSECTRGRIELQNYWDENEVLTLQYRYFFHVPENYDGAALVVLNHKFWEQSNTEGTYLYDHTDDDTIFFRLK